MKIFILLGLFHTLRDGLKAQGLHHIDDGFRDHPCGRVRHHRVDKGLVYLQRINGQLLQIGKRRKTRAEIIQGNPDPIPSQYLQSL